MELTGLYHPGNGTMRVAGFMSGSGSNLRRIIEHGRRIKVEQGREPYEVVVIFSNNSRSNAEAIGREHNIPVVLNDADSSVRGKFDAKTIRMLRPFDIDVAAYAGYMLKASGRLVGAFFGVNVHPACLSTMCEDGVTRKYVGDKAVRKAILAGEKELRATTHIVAPRVDYGKILMISQALPVSLPDGFDAKNDELVKRVVDEHQSRLKEVGDWVIFPKTLEYIADGRFSQDSAGNLYFDGQPIPNGLRL